MINPKTWFVLSLLASATQLSKVINSGYFNYINILTAIIYGAIIGGVWAYIAGWARERFFKSLTDSYIAKIKWAGLALGIFLIASIFYHL
jgi:hypothetical protein